MNLCHNGSSNNTHVGEMIQLFGVFCERRLIVMDGVVDNYNHFSYVDSHGRQLL